VFRNGLTVVKFGSSVLRKEDDLPVVVEEIARWLATEQYVLVVVSALGNTTEELFKRAGGYGEPTNDEAVARLVATGEEASAALLALALGRAGIGARLLGPEQIRLIAEGAPLDAKLSGVRRSVFGRRSRNGTWLSSRALSPERREGRQYCWAAAGLI